MTPEIKASCDGNGELNPSREFEAYSIQYIAQEMMTKYEELTT